MYKSLRYQFTLALTCFFCFLNSWADNENTSENNKTFTIVLDAGHGGHDAGAVGAFSKEKDINLKVTLAVGRLLAENAPEVKIVYTRRTDVFIPLDTRAEIANKSKADLFVSIHTNSLPKGHIAYGSETYTLGMARAAANLEVAKRENSVITYEKNYKQTYEGFDPNKAESYIIFELLQDRYMKQSVELARSIQQQYVNAGRKNKGVHQAGFLVLRKTSMPAVLTELGFISTPEEERYLNSETGVQTLARSIYNGIAKYRGSYGKLIPQTISPIVLPNDIDKAEPSRMSDVSSDLLPAVVPVDPDPQPNKQDKRQTMQNEQTSREQSVTTPSRTDSAKRGGSVVKEKQVKQQPTAQPPKKDATPVKRTPLAETSANTKNAKVSSSSSLQTDKPVFKVQIFVADRQLKNNDTRFKGVKGIGFYKDGKMYKYTVGESNSYSEIKQTQKSVKDKFPENFIVAFINGERINLAEAIKMAK